MQVLDVLNQWLEPSYRDHWRVFGQFRQVGIEPTPLMLNSPMFEHGPTVYKDAPQRLAYLFSITCIDLDHCKFWTKSFFQCADLLQGARWTSGRLVIRYSPLARDYKQHLIVFTQPFCLEYPYHFPFRELVEVVECPKDLEFLWCWSTNRVEFARQKHAKLLAALLPKIENLNVQHSVHE